jgi:hypothetical protein
MPPFESFYRSARLTWGHDLLWPKRATLGVKLKSWGVTADGQEDVFFQHVRIASKTWINQKE